ncbi:MAG: aldehyde ferredoxin oxidoreductase family protein [Thermoplasmata archaeon]|nr:aldehyde ferredoxin oxidoreductase family protein [Thermoplasmata archaeon]
MFYGYTGRMLDVDLSTGGIKEVSTNKGDAERFIGGKGLGAKMLYDLLNPDVDPLDPENVLIFITGPLTGTLMPTSGRFAVVTKSPLTGLFLDSQVGGYFGPEMKFSGYDAIVIRGKSEKPVYLSIFKDDIEIKDAGHLWGKTTSETTHTLRKELGDDKTRVAEIGPAGEKLVKYAMINIDTYDQKERGGQAGRGGAGAVMGSKNLKAIAIKASARGAGIRYADEEGFRKAAKNAFKKVNENEFIKKKRRVYGTPIWIKPMSDLGILPTRNFQTGTFEYADNISGERMRETIVVGDKGCYACPILCGKHSRVKEGKYKGTELEGPEYELLALLGSNCYIGALDAVSKASSLVDELGLDGISTGNVLGFAMECYEKGLLSKEMLDGFDLDFGRDEPYISIIKKIAYREGIGNLLAEGVRIAAEKIGGNAKDFAMHVKGMEFPGYDPRGSFGMGLAYATSDRGACHQRAWTVRAEIEGALGERFSIDGRAQFVKEVQDERAAAFSLVVCDFAPLDVGDFVEMLNTATGFKYTPENYLLAGERIWNLIRLFNVREGVTRKDDNLPKRVFEPMKGGATDGVKLTEKMFNDMVDEYYELRGWDSNGIPTDDTLKRLDLQSLP